MKRLLQFCLLVFAGASAYAAISANCVWEIRQDATAGNVNGGGFVTGASGTDYSQQPAAQLTLTDPTTDGTGTPAHSILLCADAAAAHVGNIIHINSAATNFIVGWYEIVSVSVGVSYQLDRACASGNGSGAPNIKLGGAMSLNSTLDDELFESGVAGNIWYVKYSATPIALGETVIVGTGLGTTTALVRIVGYDTTRTTTNIDASRPTLNCGANTFSFGTYFSFRNIICSGTGTSVLQVSTSSRLRNCKITNTSATANRSAVSFNITSNHTFFGCEFASTNGYAIYASGSALIIDSYIHDSVYGVYTNSATQLLRTIIHNCSTSGYSQYGATTSAVLIEDSTIYGVSTTAGVGISLYSGSNNVQLRNTIVSGWATGIAHADATHTCSDDYCAFYNNDANGSNWTFSSTTKTSTDPQFTNGDAGDFSIGTNLKAAGSAGVFPGGLSTGYLDMGAVQRQEAAAAGGEVTSAYVR